MIIFPNLSLLYLSYYMIHSYKGQIWSLQPVTYLKIIPWRILLSKKSSMTLMQSQSIHLVCQLFARSQNNKKNEEIEHIIVMASTIIIDIIPSYIISHFLISLTGIKLLAPYYSISSHIRKNRLIIVISSRIRIHGLVIIISSWIFLVLRIRRDLKKSFLMKVFEPPVTLG